MKKLLLLTFACIVAFTAISWANKMFHAINVESIHAAPVLLQTKIYPVNEIKKVSVSTSGGSISVSGDAATNATIEMYVQAGNGKNLSKDEIQQILSKDYEISITSENGTLTAIAKRKAFGSWKNALSVSFKVHTANGVGTDLNTSGGSIGLASLHGDEHFETSGGSLQFENLSGNIDGHTSGGSIHASNCSGNIKAATSGGSLNLENLSGNIDMRTSGGSISAQNIKGMLNTRTSGGSIKLHNIAAKVYASTSGGSITADLNELKNDVVLSTSGGSISLSVPQGTRATLDLSGTRVNADNLSSFNGTFDNHKKLNGKINGGGASLTASTSAGTVNLSFK